MRLLKIEFSVRKLLSTPIILSIFINLVLSFILVFSLLSILAIKTFAIMRNNPYPWILQINDLHIFGIDSESGPETFANYIRESRTVS